MARNSLRDQHHARVFCALGMDLPRSFRSGLTYRKGERSWSLEAAGVGHKALLTQYQDGMVLIEHDYGTNRLREQTGLAPDGRVIRLVQEVDEHKTPTGQMVAVPVTDHAGLRYDMRKALNASLEAIRVLKLVPRQDNLIKGPEPYDVSCLGLTLTATKRLFRILGVPFPRKGEPHVQFEDADSEFTLSISNGRQTARLRQNETGMFELSRQAHHSILRKGWIVGDTGVRRFVHVQHNEPEAVILHIRPVEDGGRMDRAVRRKARTAIAIITAGIQRPQSTRTNGPSSPA